MQVDMASIRRDVEFLLFAAAIVVCAGVAGAAAEGGAEMGPANLVEACNKAVKQDRLVDYCVQVFLKDKAGELTDVNDWEKMSRVVLSEGAANAAAIEKRMAEMANNQSLSALDRATLTLCQQNLKSGSDLIGEAAETFMNMKKMTEHDLAEVQIMVDNGKASQGKCEDMLESQTGMEDIWQEVHDAYLASRIVSRFLDEVKPQ